MARDFKYFSEDLQKLSNHAKNAVQRDLPRAVAVIGVNHFKSSWEHQGFEDVGVKKWSKRKAPKQGTAAYKRFMRREGRSLLYSHARTRRGTHLKDSIRSKARKSRVLFTTDKIYAQIHNEGGKAGRNHSATIPQRQFMGKSKALDNKIEAKANSMVNDLINN